MGEISVLIKGKMDIYLIQLIEKETDRVYKNIGFARSVTSHFQDETKITYKPIFKEIKKES